VDFFSLLLGKIRQPSGKRHHFHLAAFRACLFHQLLDSLGDRVLDPFAFREHRLTSAVATPRSAMRSSA
jgi:hypothetical protein